MSSGTNKSQPRKTQTTTMARQGLTKEYFKTPKGKKHAKKMGEAMTRYWANYRTAKQLLLTLKTLSEAIEEKGLGGSNDEMKAALKAIKGAQSN